MSKPGNLSRMPRQASSSHSATDFSSQSVIPSATVTVGSAGKRNQSSSICRLKWTLVRRHCSLAIPQWRYGARRFRSIERKSVISSEIQFKVEQTDLVKALRQLRCQTEVARMRPVARQTRIQGVVTLRVSTDGKQVSAVDAENGPPLLVKAAKENVKTWQFEPHTGTKFEITFHNRLLPVECDSDCNCD